MVEKRVDLYMGPKNPKIKITNYPYLDTFSNTWQKFKNQFQISILMARPN